MIFLVLSLACMSNDQNWQPVQHTPEVTTSSVTSSSSTTETTAEATSSTYIYDNKGNDIADPLLDLATVEDSIAELFEVLQTIDPVVFTTQYEMVRVEQGDSSCPYYYVDDDGVDYYGYQYWYDTCSTEDGAVFEGYGYGVVYEPYQSGSEWYYDNAYVDFQGIMTDRLGNGIEGSIYSSHYSYGYPPSNDQYGYAYIYGDVRQLGDQYDANWFTGSEYSVALDYSWGYYDYEPEDAVYLYLSGTMSGLSGETNTVMLEDFFFYNANIGSPCELEPAGTISVRDADGEWYQVIFNGPMDWGSPVYPPDCDGCGKGYYRGAYLGEVCPDFESITKWTTRPWN